MRKRKLGRDGPELSVVGFGAWEAGGTQWGPNESDDVVIEAIRAAIDAGITWIDTAEVYGDGVSETLVGRAVAGWKNRGDGVIIASKVAPRPEGTGFRPDEIRRACRASLERLGTDRIDLYQLHWPDSTGVPVEDSWTAMAGLVDEGLVRSIGVSNFDRTLLERCLAIRHVDSLQPEFSMLELENRELIRWCGERGVGVISYGPLAFGLLTGAITAETEFPGGDWRSTDEGALLFGPGSIERNLAVVEELHPIAARLGLTLAQLALAWNVHQPGVTAALAGSRNPEHVRSNARAGDVDLDDVTLKELEALLPLDPHPAG